MQHYKLLSVFFFVFFTSVSIYAQTIPSVQAPTAPIVTAPTVTAPTPPVLSNSSGFSAGTQQTTSQTNSSTQTASNTLSSELTATALQTISSFVGGSDQTQTTNILQNLSSLGNSDSLTGLLQSTNTENPLASVSSTALLQEISVKLDELLSSTNENLSQNNIATEKNPTYDTAQILRFTASNTPGENEQNTFYNLLPTCDAVFISEPTTDGTFLLTCDRTYNAHSGLQNETVYMLFQAKPDGNFDVALNVRQQNAESILYQLSEYSPLTATRTGNLVTLRTHYPAPELDMLLDIDFQN